LADALPVDIKVCIVADRGFGDQKLYRDCQDFRVKAGFVTPT
jgi:hypothetical protein